MNIQIYMNKRNFDVQRAERFFKERRIPYQLVDLKRHKLGAREMTLFASCIPVGDLVDREDKTVRNHPVCYMDNKEFILKELTENPSLIRSPIVRNGNMATIGSNPELWLKWINSDNK